MIRRVHITVTGLLIVAVCGPLGAAGPPALASYPVASTSDGSRAPSGLADERYPQPRAVLEQQLRQLRSAEGLAATEADQPAVDQVPARDHRSGQPTARGSAVAASQPASDAGAVAVTFALAQRGKPYLWGATGPTAFDCSGLTQQAYRHAGVSIPRTSRQQARIGTLIRLVDLRPGDLLFYAYNPYDLATVHHVAMYVGAGQVVHAPQAGDQVKLSPIWLNNYAGAVRPTAAPAGYRPDLEPGPTVKPTSTTTAPSTTTTRMSATSPSPPTTTTGPTATTVPTTATSPSPPTTTTAPTPTTTDATIPATEPPPPASTTESSSIAEPTSAITEPTPTP